MPGDRLTGSLLALALALGALLLWLGRGEAELALPPAGDPPRPATLDDATGVGPPLPPLASLTDTVDRPLFSPDRRPSEAGPEEATGLEEILPVATSAPPSLTLSAVIIERDRRQALLVPIGGGAVKHVMEGEEVDGWTLGEVREQGVTLLRGDDRHELALRTFEPPPQPASPRAAPRAAAPARAEPARPPGTALPIPRPRRPLRGPRRRSLQRDDR